ncbi:TPA: IS91 family transposase [Escherichia coli]
MKDTITPLNYTKEAIKDLSVMEKGLRSNAPLTSYIMRQVIDMLDSSVKFILPNCCDIIEPEEYRQTHFDLARLPYPVVTFEIPWFKDNVETQIGDFNISPSSRRIALCWEARQSFEPGIFCAIHTYGRRLNWHPHVHVSVTCGGLNKHGQWKKLSFLKDAMRSRWMWNMRQLLLKAWSEGMAMPESLSHITTESQWRSLVLKSGGKYWHVYMSKKTAGGRNTARYLGRYLKKPPIAASRLAHYNGGASLSFRYLDHKTGETATETLTQRELVARLKQHIPEKFFKMVRYFGFLANRVCGEKLPQVYRALGMDKPEPVAKVCYAQMVKQFLSRDPFECVLCGCRMVYRRAIAGLNVSGLKKNARDISLLRYMPA